MLEIVFTVAVYRRGRWTYTYAVGNALLGAAFAIPALYLLANHLLFNPAFVDGARRRERGLAPDHHHRHLVRHRGLVVWDAIDGFLKARRASAAVAG